MSKNKRPAADAQPIEVVDLNPNQSSFIPADEAEGLAFRLNGIVLEDLPVAVQGRVQALKTLEEERANIEKEYLEERKKLALLFRNKFAPLYVKRSDIISGKVEAENVTETADSPKGVPEFWTNAIKAHPGLMELITEEDEAALKSLVDIRAIDKDDMTGFKLEFHFTPNDFFENDILTKSYVIPNMMEGGEPVLEDVVGTEIKWKAGKNLTVKEITKKQRKKSGKGAGSVRTVTKLEPCDSFFNFFTAPKLPDEENEYEEEEEDDIMQQIDADFEIALTLRDKIVPQAILWFTGEAEYDDDEDYEYEGDEDEEDDEDEDEDSETDEGGAIHPTAAKNPAAGGEQAPECKNQ